MTHSGIRLIGIGGGHSGSGKTTLACALLRGLPGWGAVKCSPDELYVSVVDERSKLAEPGTDTAAYLDAGASEVLWVRGGREDIAEALELASNRLMHLPGVIVEGNRAIEVLNPDVVIFIFGRARLVKPSAISVMARADVLVYESGMPPEMAEAAPASGARCFQRDDTDGLLEYVRELVAAASAEVSMDDKDARLGVRLRERSKEGRISCAEACGIADELKLPRKTVGKAADELGIRIVSCQLGCF